MNTIMHALSALTWPILFAMLVSAVLWFIARLWSVKGIVERVTGVPTGALPTGNGAAAPGTNVALGMPQPGTTARMRRRRSLSVIPVLAAVVGLALSVWIATEHLYVPMVSVAYQDLYSAYCRADAVGPIVAKNIGSDSAGTATPVNGCTDAEPGSPSSAPERHLTRDDVFFLLNSLALLSAKEDSAKLMSESAEHSKLVTWLTDPTVYYPDEPTTLLMAKLAGKIGYGNDAGRGESPPAAAAAAAPAGSVRDATEAPCRAAGLSLVMAQQPYLSLVIAQQPYILWAPSESVGRYLLRAMPIGTMSGLFHTSGCSGDAEIKAHGLGSGFLASARTSFLPLLNRPEGRQRVNDSEVVSIALAWSDVAHSNEPEASRMATEKFMRAISSEVSGVESVRDARIAANFFVGVERLAILTVSTFLVLCLVWQQAMNVVANRDVRLIRGVLEKTAEDRGLRLTALTELRRLRYRNVGRSAPREILAAALEVSRQQLIGNANVDFQRVHRVAESELSIVDRRRFFFLAGLPVLPTIGFIGTVRSLIDALSIADNIPRARDAVDQVTAVGEVTATLSLCFSTTFMALCALLVFAPLDLWQASSEHRVVEETERMLDSGV